jgi:predicted cobalt transporter CbtA
MLTGLGAALLAFVFAQFVGEPHVDAAIAFEKQAEAALGAPAGKEIVSRSTQSGIGLAVALAFYGVALGGLLAIACAFAYGRIGAITMRSTVATVGAAAFTAVVLVPFLKYPPNPPGVGNPDTIDRRTTLYFLMMLIAVLAAAAAVGLGRQLSDRLGGWNAGLAAAATFVAVVAVAVVALPFVDEIPDGYPADLLWNFRLSSLGTQVTMWAALSLGFATLAQRVVEPSAPRLKKHAAAAEAAASPATSNPTVS